MTSAAASNMPDAEVDVTSELAKGLLAEQHPDLKDRELAILGVGWDNVMFRLGDDLTVRIPRRAMAAPLIEHEQRWLPVLAPKLPLPISAPVRIGGPSEALGYPWAWSVLPWFDGTPVGAATPSTVNRPAMRWDTIAGQLGRFLAALHAPAPADAPKNPWRGCPLAERDAMTVKRIERMTAGREQASLLERWRRCVDQPPHDGPPMWLHGDLHPFNILHQDGSITAVIDFGDITSGDPATDLAIGFSLLEEPARSIFKTAADSQTRPIDDATWARAEGWSLSVGLAVLASSADNPAMEFMARNMVFGPGKSSR